MIEKKINPLYNTIQGLYYIQNYIIYRIYPIQDYIYSGIRLYHAIKRVKRQPPPHRRNRNAANNIFISEQAEQQRRILNITSTAQNETPFALFLSLQFWHEQNTGAYKTTPYHFNMEESAQPTTKQKNVQQKGNKRLTSR